MRYARRVHHLMDTKWMDDSAIEPPFRLASMVRYVQLRGYPSRHGGTRFVWAKSGSAHTCESLITYLADWARECAAMHAQEEMVAAA